jgi:alanine racemase
MLNWVEVDASAIRWNIDQFRLRLGSSTLFGAVVKANAYGHGILEVAELARGAGVEWLCVNGLDEAALLRRAGHGERILVMGHVELQRLGDVVDLDLRPVVYNRRTVELLDAAARKRGARVHVHLKIETGTQRQGIAESDLEPFVELVRSSPGLVLEGVTTHFANIEDTTDHRYATAQFERFNRAIDTVQGCGVRVPLRHAACSAAALLFARTHLDMARVGIALYGLWPSRETYVSCLEKGASLLDLRPALTWKTRVAQVKQVPADASVGYGCTFRTNRPSTIAVLPVGYHEGYDRGLSGVAHVLVRGRRAPVIGRICMNMCMVDLTDVPGAGLEDEVVLLGSQGAERVSAEQLAAWCGTISYEIVSRIHAGLPRVVLDRSTGPAG